MYSEIYLRLEPLGIERVAAATLAAGHEVRILDLQLFSHREFKREIADNAPDAIGFSLNYLANVPEVIDLAAMAKARLPRCFIFAGGHSASFVADELLEHGDGAIDCVVRGEGETATPMLLDAIGGGRPHEVPGVVPREGGGPPPVMLDSLDRHLPARHLTRRRNRYFIGELDPCASIEFTRGCPWDCSFCSAWTFYGRGYRQLSAAAAADDMASIREPNVFIVDDVAFIHPEHGFAIGREIEKRKVHKRYYLETRADVLCRNREVFEYWRRLGLTYMFMGLEAIDAEGLKAHRKRASAGTNLKALEIAREIGLTVAINLIAEPHWDERQFAVVRDWALSVPEVVHLTVATPYPGTETWLSEGRLPLKRFYEELVRTQGVINRKHLGWNGLRSASGIAARLLMRGQTNFVRMLWKFNKVYNADRQYLEHFRDTKYLLRQPAGLNPRRITAADLYVHPPKNASLREREIPAT
jgi:magnesium-protoporphyrin IX monomethyl ester (oxidative) cyclase